LSLVGQFYIAGDSEMINGFYRCINYHPINLEIKNLVRALNAISNPNVVLDA